MKKLILLVSFGMLIGSSCKKEEPESIAYTVQCSKTVFDPPVVLGADLNLPFDSLTVITKYFDINCDEINDLRVIIEEGISSSIGRYQKVNIQSLNLPFTFSPDSVGLGSIIDSSNFLQFGISNYTMARNDELVGQWVRPYAYQFLPFKFYLKMKPHYGYIKLSLSGTEPPLWQQRAHLTIEEFYVHSIAEVAVTIQ